MRTTAYILLAMLVVSCGGQNKKDEPQQDTLLSYLWRTEQMADLEVSAGQGLAGGVAAVFDHTLMTYGGANFPDRPAAEGGRKQVYGCCYALRDTMWQKLPTDFPARAYAAVAHSPRGVYVLGGNDGEGIVDDIMLWMGNTMATVGRLPVACENAAAAYADDYIYIVGGQTHQGATAACWRAHIDSLETGWERLPDLPRSARVQASAAWLDGRLYVAGGYDPADGTVNATLVAYNPETRSWGFVDSLRRPGELQTATLVGGTMLADRRAHRLLFIGGVDATIFQEAISRPMHIADAERTGNKQALERLRREAVEYMLHAPDWYRFNGEVMSYSPERGDEYRHETYHASLARAGSAVVMDADTVYVVNGELKPGIRSTTTIRLVR